MPHPKGSPKVYFGPDPNRVSGLKFGQKASSTSNPFAALAASSSLSSTSSKTSLQDAQESASEKMLALHVDNSSNRHNPLNQNNVASGRNSSRSESSSSQIRNISSPSPRATNFDQPHMRAQNNVRQVSRNMNQIPPSRQLTKNVNQPSGESRFEKEEFHTYRVLDDVKSEKVSTPSGIQTHPATDDVKHAVRRCYPQSQPQTQQTRVGHLDDCTNSEGTDVSRHTAATSTSHSALPHANGQQRAVKQPFNHVKGQPTVLLPSKNRNFPKVPAYDEKQVKAENRKARGERYLKDLVDLQCTLIVPYDSNAVGQRIDQVFGPNLQRASSICTFHHVCISQVNEGGLIAVKFSAKTKERVRSAIADYKNMLNEARTRAKESSMQVIWDKWEGLDQDVILKAQPNPKKNKVAAQIRGTVPAVGSWAPHFGYRLTSANFEKLSKSLVAAFEGARSYYGILRLRVSLGTVILERTPRDVVQMSASLFQDHLDEIDEAEEITFSPSLMEHLDQDQDLLMKLVKAPSSNILAPKDISIQNLSQLTSICNLKARLFFRMPEGGRLCYLEVALSEGSTEVRKRWIQYDTDTGTTTEPKCRMRTIIACPNEYGLCWKFELSTAKETRDIPEKWINSAKLIRKKAGTDPWNNIDFLAYPGPAAWPLERVQLIREYGFRIHNCGYELEVDHVVDTPYVQGRPALEMRAEYRMVSVVHNQWEAILRENERSKAKRSGAAWKPCLQQFFPVNGYINTGSQSADRDDSGLKILLDKLSVIETLITGQYVSSSAPPERSQAQRPKATGVSTVRPWRGDSGTESDESD